VELANLTAPTLAEVIQQAHRSCGMPAVGPMADTSADRKTRPDRQR
jgi:hypothetical protein